MNLKNIILIITFVTTSLHVYSQQIHVSGLYSSSSVKEFKNSWGYDVGYSHFINKQRLGISFCHYFYNTPYDDIYTSIADGVSKFIEEYEPNNRRIAVNLMYSYPLIDNGPSHVYVGGNVNMNYYTLQGQKQRIESEFVSGGTFEYNNSIQNRLGFGMLIEYEICEVISDKISTSIKINPEFTAYDEWGIDGGYNPWLIGWINVSLGLKYSLTN